MAGRGRGRSTRSEGRTIARKYAVPSRYIWVGNLPDNITEGALVDLFQQFGELDRVCLQVGRNFAFVDFKYEDAAFAAMQALQGFNFAGNPIIVEFTKDNKFASPPVFEQPHKPDPRTIEELPPTESLWVGYPPSIEVSETILRTTFSPFGPIRKITTFSDRSYSFVTFETISSSIRAKQTLEGRLFNNPRVQIRFAKSESGPSDPLRYPKNLPLSQPFESRNLQNLPHFSEEIRGVKRMRTFVADDELPEFTPSVPIKLKEWTWEGVIAKGGNQVCSARCFPVGRPMDMMLPPVVDCTARTSTEMLSKHYFEAPKSWVVFFVPQTDADIESYNDFMHYLAEKQRVAVAKINEDTTLFLIAPSEFSEKVLKVPGKLSISGVVLRLQPQNTNAASGKSQSYPSRNEGIPELPRGSPTGPVSTLQPEQIALLAKSILGKRAADESGSIYGVQQGYGLQNNYSSENIIIAERPPYFSNMPAAAQLASRLPLQTNQVTGGLSLSISGPQMQVQSGPEGPSTGHSEDPDPGRRLQATLQLAATLLQNVQQRRGT